MSDQEIREPEQVTCPACGGSGDEEVTITHDMALDAGDPSYAGRSWSRSCSECGGDGWVLG